MNQLLFKKDVGYRLVSFNYNLFLNSRILQQDKMPFISSTPRRKSSNPCIDDSGVNVRLTDVSTVSTCELDEDQITPNEVDKGDFTVNIGKIFLHFVLKIFWFIIVI